MKNQRIMFAGTCRKPWRNWASFAVAVAFVITSSLNFASAGQGKGGGGGGGGTTPPPNPEIVYVNWQSGNLSVVNADGTNSRAVFTKAQSESIYYPAWSPDGSGFAYWSNGPQGYGIYRVNLNGSGRTLISPTINFAIPVDWGTTPAPDGERKILFVDRGVDHSDYEIYVMNDDGTGRTRLTFTPDFYEVNVFWYGDKVAYQKGQQIFAITLGLDGGGNVVAVSEELLFGITTSQFGNMRTANASPMFVFANAGLQVVDLSAASTAPRQLTTGDDRYPGFSSDDTRVVFSRIERNTWNIYTVNVDGSGARKILSKAVMAAWKKPTP